MRPTKGEIEYYNLPEEAILLYNVDRVIELLQKYKKQGAAKKMISGKELSNIITPRINSIDQDIDMIKRGIANLKNEVNKYVSEYRMSEKEKQRRKFDEKEELEFLNEHRDWYVDIETSDKQKLYFDGYLTRKEFSKLTRISRATINRWELYGIVKCEDYYRSEIGYNEPCRYTEMHFGEKGKKDKTVKGKRIDIERVIETLELIKKRREHNSGNT